MGRMVDIIAFTPAHVTGVYQEENAKENPRDGEHHIEVDFLQRGEEDICKNHSRNSPGGPYGTVPIIVLVPYDGWDRSQGYTAYIEQQVEKGSGKDHSVCLQISKYLFNISPEGVEYQHVNPQMNVVGMQKGVGEDPVVLFVMHDAGGGEIKLFEKLIPPVCGH